MIVEQVFDDRPRLDAGARAGYHGWMRYRGVAYYPEFWPEWRQQEDLRLMREARINLVRMGEFAWTAMEPAAGRFDLGWLHRAVQRMAEAGIQVMLCTPTAAPPAWLTSAHPDTLLVRRDGVRAGHGGRRQYCPTNGTYRRLSARVTERLAREFARYPNVVAWQIDNELGPEIDQCYCPGCAARFRKWLAERYGSLDSLNAAWQTRFWSVAFTDWRQIDIRRAEGYPSIELDVRRFQSDAWVGFCAAQASLLRHLHPGAAITTNMMGPLFRWIDYGEMAPHLDVASDDMYFDMSTMAGNALACDVFRSMKPGKCFWVTETGSGALSTGRGPTAEQLRAWAYSALARGSEAHVIFRWRTCLAGQEQDLQGILETSGRPRRRYEAVKGMFSELEGLWPRFRALPLPVADVAMVNSYDCRWAYQSTRVGGQVKEHQHFFAMHELFYDRNVLVDVIPPDRDLSPYRLVVLPALCIVAPGLALRLKAFVRGGGVVLATPQLASRDANNNHVPRCAPDGLNDLFGLRVESREYLDNACEPDQALWFPEGKMDLETVPLAFGDGGTGTAVRYMEDVELVSATALCTYQGNLFAGRPAAAVREEGRGAAFYMAAFMDGPAAGRIAEAALTRAGVARGPETPKWVEVVRRGGVTFAINHSREACAVPIGGARPVVGEWENGLARLPACGVCVVED
jgi:beta-galactosidase